MPHAPKLALGLAHSVLDPSRRGMLALPADHLVTHGVVVGMTGSGKTGLVTVMVEEALRARVPVLVLDVKGDLPNLMLAPTSFSHDGGASWAGALGAALAEERERGLRAAGIDEPALDQYAASVAMRLVTPGSDAGEPLHLLSALERRSPRWDTHKDLARASLATAITGLLRLVGRESDPLSSVEHVVLSVMAERRLLSGSDATLEHLLEDLANPPFEEIGAMQLDDFFPRNERRELGAALNALLASPSFASFRRGAPLDVGAWLTRPEGDPRTPCVVVSVAHLDDATRTLVLGVLLDELHTWVRMQPGSSTLRALVVFDEVYGFLPPHPADPPTKRPMVGLLKQARAFGVGIVVATQNPMDLDYRALSNAGLWCIGRLQTDADRRRVVDGLALAGGLDQGSPRELAARIRGLGHRSFLVRDVQSSSHLMHLAPRQTISLLRGPMSQAELRAAAAAWKHARAHAPVDA